MMKKILHVLFLSFFFAFIAFGSTAFATSTDKYTKTLSKAERENLCREIKMSSMKKSEDLKSPGGGIIPDVVFQNIYSTTFNITNATSLIMVLGHALTCHATRTDKQSIGLGPITLATYPNIPVWLCGAIIYFMGFMITLSITFYLVDIAFKLGFMIIVLPIGIALWPFPPTKNKLSMIISTILKNAAIFAFLGLTVSYTLNLLSSAVGDLADVFMDIDTNKTDDISNKFQLASTTFLIIVFALAYGMKLIGSTVVDYADKFFPDNMFGTGQAASPIHGSMTQAMDFAKKKGVEPIASYASDVASTQMGKATVFVGKKISGKGVGARGFVGGVMISVGKKMQQNKTTPAQKQKDEEKKLREKQKFEQEQNDIAAAEATENFARAERNNNMDDES